MILKKIQLNNFRKYTNAAFEFERGVNVICGENGVGKTNILEAVHFLATAKSHRTSREPEMVRGGAETAMAEVSASFEARGRDNEVLGRLALTGKKQFKKNDVPVRRTSDLMGFLSVVMFSPDDLSIIKGAPGQRRKMLDLAICQMSKKYFHLVYSYGRVLAQKNKLLKTIDGTDDRLDVWDEQLAVFGAQINSARFEYIEKLGEIAGRKFSDIMELPFSMEYVPNGEGGLGSVGAGNSGVGHSGVGHSGAGNSGMGNSGMGNSGVGNSGMGNSGVGDADMLLKMITRNRKKEIKQRQALVGPHRDDFIAWVNHADARNFASQGQQRSAVIALKMAQVEILRERLGEPPILLLDDVMSELDGKRQAQILVPGDEIQVIITTTKAPRGGNVIKLA